MTTVGVFAAVLLALLVIRLVYKKFCLENLDVRLSFSAQAATEGDSLTLTEVITNEKWLPLPWLAVKFQVDRELDFADRQAAIVSDLYYRNDLFHILMHQRVTRRLGFTCAKRGYYAIRGLEITCFDILATSKHIRRYECDARLTVYPSTLETAETDALCTQVYGHLKTRRPIHPDPFSFRGIREYSPNDPMKSVNFKASAKSQEMMVNVWDFSNARQVVLLLDAERYSVWHSEELEERAIKIAASLAERMTAQNIPIAFTTNGLSARSAAPANIPDGRGTQHLRTILEALAYLDLYAGTSEPFCGIVEGFTLQGRLEPEYWLVSPYYSKNLDAALQNLNASGARTAWIMPKPMPRDADFGHIIFV